MTPDRGTPAFNGTLFLPASAYRVRRGDAPSFLFVSSLEKQAVYDT